MIARKMLPRSRSPETMVSFYRSRETSWHAAAWESTGALNERSAEIAVIDDVRMVREIFDAAYCRPGQ